MIDLKLLIWLNLIKLIILNITFIQFDIIPANNLTIKNL